jgi:hypothetical protein
MEITSFALGILSVIFLLGIVVHVFSALKISKLEKEINSIKMDIADIHRRISEVSELDNRRIDNEVGRVDELVNNIYRDIDSRFDKFQNRIKAETKNK